ncbi:MAG: FapA family protein, partial [Lachnospiraceae bacterium]|nr:FapA family protein [Lachnospiraceae bacterium]
IGSEMGAATRVEVGTDPAKKERFLELKTILAEGNSELEKIKLILATYTKKLQSGEKLPPEKMGYVQKLAYSYKAKQSILEPAQEEYNILQRELSMANSAKVQIKKSIYPGVTISISEMEMMIKDEQSFCQFTKRDGEIVRSTL